MLQLANVLSNNKFFKASATHYSGLGIRSLALLLKIAHTVLLSDCERFALVAREQITQVAHDKRAVVSHLPSLLCKRAT